MVKPFSCAFRSWVLVTLVFSTAWAQSVGRITGTIKDQATGKPIHSVNIVVKGTGFGASSNKKGQYAIKDLPVGEYTLIASHIGYKSATKLHVKVRINQTTKVDFVLTPTIIQLPGSSVTALLPSEEAERSHAFVAVIRAEEFESRAVSLPEVLAQTAGVQIKKLGGLGSYSTLSVRGTSGQQVRVYLDGVALNSALGGGVNLGNIPLSNVERIEVYKGTIPTKFGGSGLGGVVHIVTKRAGSKVGSYGLKSGTFGTHQGSVFFSRSYKSFNYLAALDYTESDNDFPFLDDNGTRYNKADDEWKRRQNNGFRSLNLVGKILWNPAEKIQISLNNNFCWSYKGIPGRGSYQSKFARLKVIRNLTELSFLKHMFLNETVTLRLKLFNSYYASDYRDLKAEVGLGKQDNHNVTRTYGGEISLKFPLGQYQVSSLLLKLKQESFLPSDRLHNEQLFESRRWSYLLAIENEVVLFWEKLNAIFSLRQENYQSRFYGDYTHGHWIPAPARKRTYQFLSYRLGIKYKTFHWLTIKGNIGKYHRVPSFYELFGDKGATIGNTKLEPEQGLTYDIGVRILIPKLAQLQKNFLEIAYFENKLTNLIQFIQHSQMTSRPENIGKAFIQGVEVTTKSDILNFLRFQANLTYQRALNRSKLYGNIYYNKQLPNKAQWEINLRPTIFLGNYLEAFYDYSFTDQNFHDPYNKVPIEKRIIHNIGLKVMYPRWQVLKFTVEAKNLSDNQVADLWGYPLPGRSYYVIINGAF